MTGRALRTLEFAAGLSNFALVGTGGRDYPTGQLRP